VTHEEKRTDVNIAIKLLIDAVEDRYDKALIISADSDLLPAIIAVRNCALEKELGVMFPIGRGNFELREKANFRRKMSEELLRQTQFPDKVPVGDEIIERPANWS
jgi:uncharacterized LabA/DUF88 family protein